MRCQHLLGCLCVQWPQRKGTDILRLHGWQSILGQKAEQLDPIDSNCRDRWHELGALKCSFKDMGQRAPCVSSKCNADKLHTRVMAAPEWKEGLKAEGEGHGADICSCGEWLLWLLCYLKRLPPRSHVTCQKWLMSNHLGTFTALISTCRVILYCASLPVWRDQLQRVPPEKYQPLEPKCFVWINDESR